MTASSEQHEGGSGGGGGRDDLWPFWRRMKLQLFIQARKVVVPLLRLAIGLRIEGLENVPSRGGALMISNHLHNSDPILLVAAYPRPIFFMAKKEVFGVPVARWFARQAGAFPIDRGHADRGALRQAEFHLAEGMIVGVFPEGTRATTGGLKEVFPGVALIAQRAKCPIIPTAIFGTETLPFNGAKGRRPASGRTQVTVRIGRPFTFPERHPGEPKPDLARLTDAMMLEVAKLLPPQYHGIYADRMRQLEYAVSQPDDQIVNAD